MISAIFAVDSKGGLGKNGSMPWPRNKEDLAWFREHTLGHTVVMGGNTWRDPDMPKPLPKRTNIVITTGTIDTPGVICYNNNWIDDVRALEGDVFIIGGVNILNQARGIIDRVYLTEFAEDYGCDVKMDVTEFLKGFHFINSLKTETALYTIWNRTT